MTTHTLEARYHDDGSGWSIGRNGKLVGNAPTVLVALKQAVRNLPGPSAVNIFWASPPDASFAQQWHDKTLSVHELRQLNDGQ